MNRKIIFVIVLSVFTIFAFPLRHCLGFDVVQVTNTPDMDEKSYSIAMYGNTIYAIWRDFNTGLLYFDKSTDGGSTWDPDPKILGMGLSGGYDEQYNNPPAKILVDKTGNLFVVYNYESKLYFLKSTDGGEVFSYGGDILLPLSNYIFDFAINETGDTIYIVSVAGNVYMCKSTDGGDSFSYGEQIIQLVGKANPEEDTPAQEIRIETNKTGNEVYLFFVNAHKVPNIGTPPRVWRNRVDFSRSLNSGAAFDSIKSVLVGEWPGLDASFRHWGKNIDTAIDGNGNLYVSWTIQPSVYPNGGIPAFVVLSKSYDKGKTFGSTAVSSGTFKNGLIGEDLSVDWARTSLAVSSSGDVLVAFIKGAYTKGTLTGYDIYFKTWLVGSKLSAETLAAGPLYLENLSLNLLAPATQISGDAHAAIILWRNNVPATNNHDLYSRRFFLINTRPVLQPIGNKTVDEGQTLDFTVIATDADGDVLSYSIKNIPRGAEFNTKTGQFIWTPDYDQDKTYKGIKFTVSDGALSTSRTITIKVNNTNRPPTIEPIGNKSIVANTLLQFTVEGSDPDTVTDKQKLTYSVINRPTGASINSKTGVFKWKPTVKQVREQPYVVTFVVSDGKLSAADTIEIRVLAN
jgi:hypothetical protein